MNTETQLSEQEKSQLLSLAADSIKYGLSHHCEQTIDFTNTSPALRENRATFVTLKLNNELRGCIGSLEANQPLAADVAHQAYAAAFNDPRFTPLSEKEFAKLEIQISILNPPEKMTFTDEADLIRQLRPGIDGLILTEGNLRSTFLPSVWESLPDPVKFFTCLKHKAGLPSDYWSESLKVMRYTTTSLS